LTILEILLIAVGLAMDAFAVSLGIGAAGRANSARPRFRLCFHFGLFQFAMPILGWLGGTSVAHLISSVDHWVAFSLLAFVGGRMVQSGLGQDEIPNLSDPSRGRVLVMLSVATSIDALAVGLSLAMLRVHVVFPSIVIGVVAAGLSLTGLLLGRRLGTAFGKRTEVLGGLILIAIGVRVLIEHMF
jgi:manganese efflux pump family protein